MNEEGKIDIYAVWEMFEDFCVSLILVLLCWMWIPGYGVQKFYRWLNK